MLLNQRVLSARHPAIQQVKLTDQRLCETPRDHQRGRRPESDQLSWDYRQQGLILEVWLPKNGQNFVLEKGRRYGGGGRIWSYIARSRCKLGKGGWTWGIADVMDQGAFVPDGAKSQG